jgi:hypothetical protein
MRANIAAGLIAVGLLVGTGCENPPTEDVVSVQDVATPTDTRDETVGEGTASAAGEPTGEPSLTASAPQKERAELLYTCLTDAGVPMSIDSYPADQAIVDIDADNAYGVTTDGSVWFGRLGLSDETQALVREIVGMPEVGVDGLAASRGEVAPERAKVVVEGKDVTADFEHCLALSHYTFPEYAVDPAEELARKQAIAEASNEWAACARDNGMPTIADVTATSDENYTPTVLLPATVTAEQLTLLMDACPTFDKDAEDAYHEAAAQGERVEAPARPSIGFDAPGWNGDNDAEVAVDVTEGDNKRLFDLQEIIFRPYSDYLESLGGVG